MSKYKFAIMLSMPLNFVILLLVNNFFGIEIAMLLGLATIIGTIDEFGYFIIKGKLNDQ